MMNCGNWGLALIAGIALGLLPSTAWSGCGCDHPPPEWSPVMPIFAPSGADIRIWSDGESFDVGTAYEVKVGGVTVPNGGVVAEHSDFIEVPVPAGVEIGPASVKVWREVKSWWGSTREDVSVDYDGSVFTVLPDFVVVPPVDGVFESADFEVAIDSEGTVLLPLDLSEILDATQFAFQFKDLALAFGGSDVVFYSKDGVDLTLFTLSVDDSTERQWGSYHGWEVDEDGGLSGYRFENKRARARDLRTSSDVLTYWRHEFNTYNDAHQPGGEYEVDSNGYHPDGTLHIEHSYIVLAIHGMKRHWMFPDNPHYEEPVEPGSAIARLNTAVQDAPDPIEPATMIPLIEETQPDSLEAAVNGYFEEKAAAAAAAAQQAADSESSHRHRSRWR